MMRGADGLRELTAEAKPGNDNAIRVRSKTIKPPSGHVVGDSGSAARFFYTAKADTARPLGQPAPDRKAHRPDPLAGALVTPPGGTFLDPFAGSGTAAAAALGDGRNAILIEREAAYVADIRERMRLVRRRGPAFDRGQRRRTEDKPLGGLFARPYDETADLLGSYHAAIEEIGRPVKTGEPVPDCPEPEGRAMNGDLVVRFPNAPRLEGCNMKTAAERIAALTAMAAEAPPDWLCPRCWRPWHQRPGAQGTQSSIGKPITTEHELHLLIDEWERERRDVSGLGSMTSDALSASAKRRPSSLPTFFCFSA